MTLTKNITQLALVLGITLGFSSAQAVVILTYNGFTTTGAGSSTVSVDANDLEVTKVIAPSESDAVLTLDFAITSFGDQDEATFSETIKNDDIFTSDVAMGMPWDGYKTLVEIFNVSNTGAETDVTAGFTVSGDAVSGTVASGNMVSLLSTIEWRDEFSFNFGVKKTNDNLVLDNAILRLTETAWLTTTTPPVAMPEPTSLALIGLALGGLGWSNRKKN